jgi:hypothetical protein
MQTKSRLPNIQIPLIYKTSAKLNERFVPFLSVSLAERQIKKLCAHCGEEILQTSAVHCYLYAFRNALGFSLSV